MVDEKASRKMEMVVAYIGRDRNKGKFVIILVKEFKCDIPHSRDSHQKTPKVLSFLEARSKEQKFQNCLKKLFRR